MKRLALLVSLALLTVVGTTATTQAYYLDTPHNESNGIYCSTCHSMSYWITPPTGTIDVTMRNAVCLQCHAEGATDPKAGPAKKLHASSSTSTKFGTWTTECTQCHDVHSQGQLDWVSSDSASLYLATGQIASTYAPANFNATDPLGGGYGTTTVAISSVVRQAGSTTAWEDTTKWTSKGGFVTSSRATDNSRGLIFTPNKNNPVETFEIVSASPTSIKVKGKMTSAVANNTYGVFYGQSLKSYVLPNGGKTAADYRNVKFFVPQVITGNYGGFVDESAQNASKPMGLCQVCHVDANGQTIVWNNAGGAQTHNADQNCGTCHNGPKGFPPAPPHSAFIGDRLGSGCGTCHSTKIANPETAHASCDICHAPTRPELNSNAMLNDGGTVLGNINSKGYTGGTAGVRLSYGGKGIADVGFQMIDCGDCHLLKPAAVAAIPPTHGGHAAGAFAWDGNCNQCHSGARIAEDVHNTAVNGCTICHTTASGGPRKAGDPTNGVDGDATLGNATSACSVCHTAVNTSGTIHHVSKNNYAANGNCVQCHKSSTTGGSVVGNRAGDHTNLVATDSNCVPCHSTNVGTSNGAPVDGAVVANKVHDNCVSCHNTNGVLKTVAEVGGTKVVAMPAGAAGSNNGGGNCSACHGVYFTNHSHNHSSSVATATLCGSCHTASNTINPTHNNNCADCHNLTTGARVNGGFNAASYGNTTLNVGDATVNGGSGGTCATCHTTYFNAHTHSHAFVNVTASCAVCHKASPNAGSLAYTTSSAPFINSGDVHGTNGCGTCHDLATNGALKGSATGKTNAVTECIGCHTASWTTLHNGKPNVSHANTVKTTVGACDTCHGAIASGSQARLASGAPFTASGEVHYNTGNGCATCHNADGSMRSTGLVKANTIPAGGGTCTACHTTAWNVVHASASVTHNVTATALCSNCHTGDAITSANIHNSNCADCHDLATGARVNGAANSGSYQGTAVNVGDATVNAGAGGACIACHSAYFNSHRHNHAFTPTAACATCHSNTAQPTASNAYFAGNATAPWVTSGEVHYKTGSTCDTCHDLSSGIPTGALKGSAATHSGALGCTSCHTTGFIALHSASTGVKHDATNHAGVARVSANAGCATCHAAVAGSSNARLAITAPFIGNVPSSEVHYNAGNGCALCHNGNDDGGVRSTGLTKASTVVAGDCTACHTATWSSSHTAATVVPSHNVSTVAPCSGCHTGDPISATGSHGTHGNNCADCHDLSTGARVNGAANAGSYGGIGVNVGDATLNSGNGGTCTVCHPAYFAAHTHTHTFTATAACATCHATSPKSGSAAYYAGVSAAKAWTTNTSGTEVHYKAGTACGTCHDLATNGALKGSAVGGTTASTCATCHSNPFTSYAAHNSATHTVNQLQTDANCNTCHGSNYGNLVNGVTENARNSGTAPFVGANAVHTTGGCTTCHNADGSKRTGTFTKAVSVTTGATCSGCHIDATHTWTSYHMNATGTGAIAAVSHAGRVDGYTGTGLNTCNSCHTGTAGGASGLMPISAADNKVHDACSTCHTATGGLVAGTTTYGGQPIAKGTCATCHTATYFDSHVHGADTAGYVVHNINYNASVDTSQPTPTGCNTSGCHLGVNAWSGANSIKARHLSGCATCHDPANNRTTGIYPTALVDLTGVIASGTSTAKSCKTCHADKTPNISHGGHSADFGSDTACTGCHAVGAGVLINIHGDGTTANCALCHTGGVGSKTTLTSGPTANGIDGDARMAYDSGTSNWAGKTCVTCHTPGATIPANGGPGSGTVNAIQAGSIGGIHHDNKSMGVVTSANCSTATCHGSAQDTKVGHAQFTGLNAICTPCHNGTIAPGATNKPYVASGQVHSVKGCVTCHQINATATRTGDLITAPAKALGLSNNGTATATNGTDGGAGDCTICHSSAYATYGFLHHDTPMAVGNNCTGTCHTATVGVANHTATVANTVATNTKFTSGCVQCHFVGANSVAGNGTGIYINPASGLIHDSCRTCHTFDANNYGILVTVTTARKGLPAAALPQGTPAIGGNNGGGICTACHTSMTTAGASATVHHSDTGGRAAVGECEYCHVDPRNGAVGTEVTTGNPNSTTFQESVASGGITPPKHLPCQDCHVTPKYAGVPTGNSWVVGGNMTILSFNEGNDTQKTMTTWSVDYTKATANTGGHVIANTSGAINNWGMCFQCHDGAKARKVAPLHAAPVLWVAANGAGASGWGTYLPGRSALTANLSNFNFLASSYRPTSTQPGMSSGNGSSFAAGWSTSVKFGVALDGGTATETTIPDPYASTTARASVPMYTARTPETGLTPVSDFVVVQNAIYTTATDALAVTVNTNSTNNCNLLTFQYLADGLTVAATGTGTGTAPNCSYTFSAVATNPTAGTSKVNVNTSSTDGVSATGFLVKVQ